MKRVLLVSPSPKYQEQLSKQLEHKGYAVQFVTDFAQAIAALSDVDSFGSDLVGVVLGWPDTVNSQVYAFLNRLSEHTHCHLATILVSEEMSAQAVGWLKVRKRSAMLLWSDFSEIPDALGRLLDPQRERRLSNLEEIADHHLRVLFVDDSPTVRIAFRRLLMRYGFLVETASSAVEGYRKALQNPFDLAIIDYFMPEHNGVALVRRLQSDERTAHIILAVITATYSDTVINDSLAAGAIECIFKNEAKELFLARIASIGRSIIDRKSIDDERRRLEGILCSVGDGVFGVDVYGVIQFVNPAARDILGFGSESEMIGGTAYDLFHNRRDDGTEMSQESCFLSRCYRSGNQISGWQTSFWSQSGRMIPVECTVLPLEIGGQRHGSVVAFRDVSARKQLEEELRWQATHDSLTKLPNRYYLEDELDRELQRLRRSEQISALLFIDLDRFKYINDTAGHAAGDRLLIEVAQRLKNRLRMSDMAARIGGDEYAVILRDIREDSVVSAADQFRAGLEDLPFMYGGKQYVISATVGISLLDRMTKSTGEAMANADIACHVAKNQGRNKVHLFSAESDQKSMMDMDLGWSTRLRHALKSNLFELQYQPILATSRIDFEHLPLEEGSLWRSKNPGLEGKRADYEVLLRLRDQQGEVIGPDAFLPTAERFNMMVDIDHWVIDHAFGTLSKLIDSGRDIRFAINLSEQTLLDKKTPEYVEERLKYHGLEGSCVTFELSETRAVTNLEATRALVSKLNGLGCRFGLDDFGTGFASFTHLKHLDVDYLKIDGTYLRGTNQDPINSAVLAAIAKIAQALGKQTIAECVDSVNVIQSLQHIGIDLVQGYFVGRPEVDPQNPVPAAGVESNVTSITKKFN